MHSDDDRRRRSLEAPYMPLKREGFWGDSPVPTPRPTTPSGVPSEKSLRFRARLILNGGALLPGVMMYALSVVLMMPGLSYGWPHVNVYPIWGVFIGFMTTIVMVIVCWSAPRKLYHYYEEVLLGTIVKKDTTGGRKKRDLEWVIVIEGYDRMGQLRKCTHTVSAGDWHDKYRVGEVVDLTSS